MRRASSYNIYVDLPDEPNAMLLVHGVSGAYDKVSKQVVTYARSLEARQAPKPLHGDWTPTPLIDGQVRPPSGETLEALLRRGYLTDLSLEQEEDDFRQRAEALHERSRAPTYVLMLTYDCAICAALIAFKITCGPKPPAANAVTHSTAAAVARCSPHRRA
jgi:uncharacterized protein